MRGARLGEVAGVREERLRLQGAPSLTTDKSGGVEGEGLVGQKMDGFLSV